MSNSDLTFFIGLLKLIAMKVFLMETAGFLYIKYRKTELMIQLIV